MRSRKTTRKTNRETLFVFNSKIKFLRFSARTHKHTQNLTAINPINMFNQDTKMMEYVYLLNGRRKK